MPDFSWLSRTLQISVATLIITSTFSWLTDARKFWCRFCEFSVLFGPTLKLTSKVTTEFAHNGTSRGLHKERYCRINVISEWFSTVCMQRPILQPCLTWRPFPKISNQAYEMQLCLQNRKSQWPKNNARYHYGEQDSFIKLMHTAALVRETRAVCKALHSTIP